jgi:soluble lytic murein transglycosylase-like protein
MADVPFDELGRRRFDRRRGRDRRLLWRGFERRRGDRRLASAAAGLVVATLLGAPRAAEAEIYSWRDPNGTLVLSSQPLDPSAKRVNVSTAPTVPAPKAAAQRRRGAQYDSFIDEQAAAHGVRPALVRGVIQAESNFNPRALSPKGAMGLMQLMPATAAELGVRNPFDALENIRGGTAYLSQLLNRYGRNETLALAAYNAGPGAVDRYGERVPPYQETQQYVKRILGSMPSAAAAAIASPKVIYKTTEVIDGYSVPRYSTSKPASGPYEIMKL